VAEKSSFFWDKTPCHDESQKRFEEKFYLHPQGGKIIQTKAGPVAGITQRAVCRYLPLKNMSC
jgi:hypothetical protein